MTLDIAYTNTPWGCSLIPRPPSPGVVTFRTAIDKGWEWRPGNKANVTANSTCVLPATDTYQARRQDIPGFKTRIALIQGVEHM